MFPSICWRAAASLNSPTDGTTIGSYATRYSCPSALVFCHRVSSCRHAYVSHFSVLLYVGRSVCRLVGRSIDLSVCLSVCLLVNLSISSLPLPIRRRPRLPSIREVQVSSCLSVEWISIIEIQFHPVLVLSSFSFLPYKDWNVSQPILLQ